MFTLTDWKQTQFYKDVKQQGKLETKLEMVPHFLKLGVSIEQIAEMTGLDVDAVENIAQQQSAD